MEKKAVPHGPWTKKKLPKNKTIKHDNKKDDAKDKSNKQNQQR